MPAAAKAMVPASKMVPTAVTKRLVSLLENESADARSIVAFIVGPTCGLENLHKLFGTPAFLMAVIANRLDVVQLLLSEHSTTISSARVPDEWTVAPNGMTALHYAAEGEGGHAMIKFLVEKGEAIDATDIGGNTPLHVAINKGHRDIALLLLTLGADPNIANNEQHTPLHEACRQGFVDVVKVLVTKGAPINVTDSYGHTSLHFAIFNGHSDLALLLLTLGADPNVGECQQPLLHLTCRTGLIDVVRALLAKGASIDAADHRGCTPLHLAIKHIHVNLSLLLLDLGANPNTANHRQQTPLHEACRVVGLIEVVRALLAKGASVSAVDSYGKTPVDNARLQVRNHELVTLLEERR